MGYLGMALKHDRTSMRYSGMGIPVPIPVHPCLKRRQRIGDEEEKDAQRQPNA